MKTIRLREGKERSLLRRHPWIFDSAIAKGGGRVKNPGVAAQQRALLAFAQSNRFHGADNSAP